MFILEKYQQLCKKIRIAVQVYVWGVGVRGGGGGVDLNLTTRTTNAVFSKAGFPLGEFVRGNRGKNNLIGWGQTLTPSLANHIRFLHVRTNKFAKSGNRLDPRNEES